MTCFEIRRARDGRYYWAKVGMFGNTVMVGQLRPTEREALADLTGVRWPA